MPNNITNIIELKGDRLRIQKLLEEIQNDNIGIGTIDFNKIIPMPAALDIDSGSQTDRGRKAYSRFLADYIASNGKSGDLMSIPKEKEQAYLMRHKEIKQEEWELGRQAFRNTVQYGAPTWYDWCIANWGTKWNSYGYEYFEPKNNTLEFFTAWGAPHPVIEKLSKMYPDIELSHRWADEDIGYNCGKYVYKDGVRQEEYFPEDERSRIAFAADVMDIDPMEYGLFLNADKSGYISLNDEPYESISLFGKNALFTNERLTDKDIPHGLYCYHLRESDDGGGFCSIERFVAVNHGGSVITKEPIDLGEQGYIPFTDETSPNFLGEEITIEDYMRNIPEQKLSGETMSM